jgi:zinc protease
MKIANIYFLVFCLCVSLVSVSAQKPAGATALKIDYEKFTLPNGLNVIFHVDRSDPVVAVSLTAHVGSAREKAGRTGFAHLFEHLLFLESENLGKDRRIGREWFDEPGPDELPSNSTEGRS